MTAKLLNTVFVLCNLRQVMIFWFKIRSIPDIAVPKTLHEKYMWRKIFERDPRYIVLSDKLLCKRYMEEHHPEVKTARVLWHGQDIRQAPAELLAGPGFLKANHASSFNLRLGLAEPDMTELHLETQKWLRRKWHRRRGEWGYKNVQPQLFIEEDVGCMAPEHQLLDLTIYVFGDYISHFAVMSDHKTKEVRFARFDGSGRRLERPDYPNPRMERLARGRKGRKPEELSADFCLPPDTDKILTLARRISGEFDHMRVDFMWNGEAFWFSEVTIYSQGGFVMYPDLELLQRMTDAWDLRRSWLMTAPQTGWRKYYAAWLARQLDSLK